MPSKTRLALQLCFVFAFVSCSGGNEAGEHPGEGSAARPSILFLTVDTLREDRTPRSGHVRDTTPYLDRLASEGVYFSSSYAQCSWTLPSMLSMFSSLPPPVFGVKQGIRMIPVRRRRIPDGKDYQDVLAEHFSHDHLMLTEVLAGRVRT